MTITFQAIENFRVCGRKRDLLTRTMMRRPSDARKREERGGSKRTLITSMKSSSPIFNPALGSNRQMVMLEDRAMLRNKNSRVTDSISTRLGLMGKKSRVIAWERCTCMRQLVFSRSIARY